MVSPPCRVAALLALLAAVAPSGADFTKSCPEACECMWVAGKRQAQCDDISLTGIPAGLSPDVQVLDLSRTAIESLPKDAFMSAGLEHIQKLLISRSRLREIHKHAFRGLHLLILLDLSNNAIDKLHVETFADNEKLRQLILSGNPLRQLTAFQFPALPYLKRLDLSECRINSVSSKAFANLDGLEKLSLNGNQLAVLDADVFQSLSELKWLPLEGNPWRCDCHLRLLRDWLVEHSLYQPTTTCAEPERLVGQSWSVTNSREFACRPEINIPSPTVRTEPGHNVTLRCQISGNPAPDTRWVITGRVVLNNTKIPFTGQTYTIHEQGTINRWTSLTVTKVTAQDAGNYLCVGTNPGGVVERNVTVEVAAGAGVSPPSPGRPPPPAGPLSRTVVLALVGGAVALLLAVLLAVCWCCCKRRCRHRHDKTIVEESVLPMSPPSAKMGEYEKVPQTDIEMERVRTPAVLTLPRRPPHAMTEDEQDPRSRRYSLPDSPMTWDSRRARDYPDLLHLPRRPGRSSPAGSSTSSTQPDQSRLPPAGPPRLAMVTPSRNGGRPGYVTLPRRQRTPSWGSGAGRHPEPVYDSLGPRTTADGSSRLSLSSTGPETLPPYYVPVEAAEPQRRTSSRTPHNLSADLIEPLREEDEWEDATSPTQPLPPPPQVNGLPPLPPPQTNGLSPHNGGAPQHTNGLAPTPPLQERPRKPTPPVAPKPKKVSPPVMPKPIVNGTHVIAFQDEGEDGTEV